MKDALLFVFSSDSDGHVAPEGEEEPELSGAVCPTAGVLSRVGHGEDTRTSLCFKMIPCFLSYFLCSPPNLRDDTTSLW